LDAAWRIFGALVDWNGKVDVKAAFTLTLDTAVLAGVVALSRSGEMFATLHGWADNVFRVGAVLTFLSALCAVVVVSPILRSRTERSTDVRNGNFIYFGHLALMTKPEIIEALKGDVLAAVAQELENTSKNAWVKNRLTQVALSLVAVGCTLIVLSVPARGSLWWVLPAVPLIGILFCLSKLRTWWWNKLRIKN
jgi:hypothetical protein